MFRLVKETKQYRFVNGQLCKILISNNLISMFKNLCIYTVVDSFQCLSQILIRYLF